MKERTERLMISSHLDDGSSCRLAAAVERSLFQACCTASVLQKAELQIIH